MIIVPDSEGSWLLNLRKGKDWCGRAREGVVRYGMLRSGMDWPGLVGQGLVRQGTVWHGRLQYDGAR